MGEAKQGADREPGMHSPRITFTLKRSLLRASSALKLHFTSSYSACESHVHTCHLLTLEQQQGCGSGASTLPGPPRQAAPPEPLPSRDHTMLPIWLGFMTVPDPRSRAASWVPTPLQA